MESSNPSQIEARSGDDPSPRDQAASPDADSKQASYRKIIMYGDPPPRSERTIASLPKSHRAKPKPNSDSVLHFVNISSHKELKSRKFKSDVKKHVMSNYMAKKKQEEFSRNSEAILCPESIMPKPGMTPPVLLLSQRNRSGGSQVRKLNCFILDAPLFWGLTQGKNVPNDPSSQLDPFSSFPFASSAVVDIAGTKHQASSLFDTEDVRVSHLSKRYAPLQDLANLSVGASCLDIIHGLLSNSKQTLTLKTEAVETIRSMLDSNETVPLGEAVIIASSLINTDLLSLDGGQSPTHTQAAGIANVVERLGGLDAFDSPKGEYLNFITVCVFKYHLLHESTPPKMFLDYVPLTGCFSTNRVLSDEPLPVTKSGSYYTKRPGQMGFIPQLLDPDKTPLIEYLPLRRSKQLSRTTHDLICDLREATNTFLNIGPSKSSPIAATTTTQPKPSHEPRSQSTIHALLSRARSLPSAPALSSHEPTKTDWVYECIRLVSLVYLTALYYHIPLSEANHLLAEGDPTRYPSTAFVRALQRTDWTNCWRELSAFLYVSCHIMAASARPFTRDEHWGDFVARRWLVLVGIKCAATLAYEPSAHVLGVLRILLEVEMRLSAVRLPVRGAQSAGVAA